MDAEDTREEARQLDELAELERAALAEAAIPDDVKADVVLEAPATCGVPYERDGRVYPERCELANAHHIDGHDDRDHYAGNIGWWRRA